MSRSRSFFPASTIMEAILVTDPALLPFAESTAYPGLRLLVLFGSRARGEAGAAADWDFGYLATDDFRPDLLLADLMRAVESDRIDLADLARAGGQLRYRVARDGRIVFESTAGLFERFWIEAVSFWCDAGPVLERAYAGVLERIGAQR